MANTKIGKKENKKVTKLIKTYTAKYSTNKKRDATSRIHNLDEIKKDYELDEDKEHITLGLIKHKLSETLEAYLELIQQIDRKSVV
jgi:hypothetical protein